MPSVSPKQHRFMNAIAHSPEFARKAGVPQSVGKDFAAADKASGKYVSGGVVESALRTVKRYAHAKGGAVKASKETANYRQGRATKQCSQCTMFRPPHDCTAVEGDISPRGLCDYFKRRAAFAPGGGVEVNYDDSIGNPMPGIGQEPGNEVDPTDVSGRFVRNIPEGFASMVTTPGEMMTGPEKVQPTTPGMWTEEDEYRKQQAEQAYANQMTNWGAGTALGMMGSEVPFAGEGKVGIFGGKGAYAKDAEGKADLEARQEQAETMRRLGASEKNIWARTGTTVDPLSGEMVHEIPDTEAHLNPEFLRYHDNLEDMVLENGRQVSDWKAMTGRAPGTSSMEFKDVLPHPELEKAYPELTNSKVIGHADRNPAAPNVLGYYSPSKDEIHVYPQSAESMRNTLLHEMQHKVQFLEGLPGGGTWEDFVSPESKQAIEALAWKQQAVRDYLQKRNIPPDEAFSSMKVALTDPNKLSKGQYDVVRQILDAGRYQDLANFMEHEQYYNKIKDQAYDNYMRLAGEAQARNVEWRSLLDSIESRQIPPWESMKMMRDPVQQNELIRHQSESPQLSQNAVAPQGHPPQDKLGFYSKADEIVSKGPSRAPAQQWSAILKNNGMKAEEDKYLGISDWLKEQDGPVSKKDLQEHIRDSRVQLKESISEGGDQPRLPEEWGGNPVQDWDERLPEEEDHPAFEPYQEGQYGSYTKYGHMVLPGGKNYKELKLSLAKPVSHQDFLHMHFENEPNIVAHARFDERLINGKKTLHINEIQSDLHQNGEKYGYLTPEEELEPQAWDDPKASKVPDAPYKKSWPELMMKRLVRYAADHDFDQISWAGGPNEIAKTEGWPDEHLVRDTRPGHEGKWALLAEDGKPRDVTPIIRRYLKEMPDIANKLGKAHGATVGQALAPGKMRKFTLDAHKVNTLPITQALKKHAITRGFHDFKRGGAVATVKKFAKGGLASLVDFSPRRYQYDIGKPVGGGQPGVGHVSPVKGQSFRPAPPKAVPSTHAGMIHSAIPGRTDKINMNVRGGSYILPADVVSGIGQGNSMAGAQALNHMFKMGPYGAGGGKVATPKVNYGKSSPIIGQKLKSTVNPMSPYTSAAGGTRGNGSPVPIVAAGGEFAIPPEVVQRLGGGDMKHGHDILDHLVLHLRKKTIHDMKHLKPPRKK